MKALFENYSQLATERSEGPLSGDGGRKYRGRVTVVDGIVVCGLTQLTLICWLGSLATNQEVPAHIDLLVWSFDYQPGGLIIETMKKEFSAMSSPCMFHVKKVTPDYDELHKYVMASENPKSFNFCVFVRTYDQFNYSSVQYEYRRTVIEFYSYRTVRYGRCLEKILIGPLTYIGGWHCERSGKKQNRWEKKKKKEKKKKQKKKKKKKEGRRKKKKEERRKNKKEEKKN
ncbi:hypothetical protein IEQ34_020199 [Dendrobium chrysotoxum]|uniref:Uncharacterized protein n=1 Tax=Dendrobium chrysotoxum TaxID=161865 RepID=A0AAV7G1T7_DENCH|nr:hypothetical protein IEQ34_020199 [Dendrobium chrysotoxum]